MSTIPAKYQNPPDVIKSRDWRLELTLKDANDSAIDITNYTLTCEMRYNDDDVSAAMIGTVTKTDAANGEFDIHFDDTLTDALDYTAYKAINFALKVTESPGGDILDYLYGTCTMRLSATA